MSDNRALPYMIAKRNDNAAFVLFGNGAIRRCSGATEMVVLAQEYDIPVRDIPGEEHDIMANISKALFDF